MAEERQETRAEQTASDPAPQCPAPAEGPGCVLEDPPRPAAPAVEAGEVVIEVIDERQPEGERRGEDGPALDDDEVTRRTASVWKYLPVPADDLEPAPEYLSGSGAGVIAARVRGRKHKHEGANCDDWYEVGRCGRVAFAAVSDGAGSKKFSRVGARESCRAAVGYMTAAFQTLSAARPRLCEALRLPLDHERCADACRALAGVVQQAVVKARRAVESAYYVRRLDGRYERELGRPLELGDLSATLLLAVVIPLGGPEDERLVVSCQVGDGMIAVVNAGGGFENALKIMGEPDSGTFSGETDFLTSARMEDPAELQRRTRIARSAADVVMLMTDGVADDYFPGQPEMLRLYLDLVVNGVLDGGERFAAGGPAGGGLRLLRRFPAPLAYPWVNDPSVQVPLHYTRRIMRSAGLTLRQLWEDPGAIALARLELAPPADDPGERLKLWLDNYVERGSFDDRTLVAVTAREG